MDCRPLDQSGTACCPLSQLWVREVARTGERYCAGPAARGLRRAPPAPLVPAGSASEGVRVLLPLRLGAVEAFPLQPRTL